MQKWQKVCLEEITPLIPVDTSNLVSKFQIGVITPDYAEVGTNVEYALYVNDGHVQHRRFYLFPTYPLEVEKNMYIPQEKGEKVRGIMLKERYIPGVFFWRMVCKRLPQNEKAGESFMLQIGREIEGSECKIKSEKDSILENSGIELFF